MKSFFIGIDFSKEKFDATVIRTSAEGEVREHGEFKNKTDGYKAFLRWVTCKSEGLPTSSWLFCGENTGIYGENLAVWLSSKGFDVWVENALAIKRSMGLVRGKSDKMDSMRIAEYAKEKQDKACLYAPLSHNLKTLKMLLSRRQDIVSVRTSLQNAINEMKRVLSDIPEAINQLNDKLLVIADELKGLEKEITALMDSIASADKSLEKNYGIVMSMKGISTINAVAMLVYTNNFNNFQTSKKMMSFWGVAPFGEYSGTSVHRAPHVSHYANRWLKGLLTQAARCAIKWNAPIRIYFDRLIKKGKTYPVALNNAKAKMINIIFHMIKNKADFDENYISKINKRTIADAMC